MPKALATRFGPQPPHADLPANKNRKGKPKFYDCGICGHWHPAAWDGDCRDDANRFTTSDLEDKYGNEGEGWEEIFLDDDED